MQCELSGSTSNFVCNDLDDETINAVLGEIGAQRLYDEGRRVMPRGVLLCSPAKAQELLTRIPPYQRSLDRAHAARIKQAMIDGRFFPKNGAALCFSRSCHLVDGHHRLTAVVASGMTFEFDVIVVADDAFATIDSNNKPRSMSQLAKIMTAGDEALTASVLAALVWDVVALDGSRFDRLQRAERVRLAVHHPQKEVAKTLYNNRRMKNPSAGMLAGALACVRVAGDPAIEFFRAAFANEHVSSAAKCLANWFLGERDRVPKIGRDRIRYEYAISVFAWNAHATGRDVQRLQGPRDNNLPVPVLCGRRGFQQ